MNKVILKNIIEKPVSGEWGEEGGSVSVLRTTNFNNDGTLNLDNVVKRNIEIKKIKEKHLIKGDVIIEKSGGSPSQPVGRVVYFNVEGLFLCNNFTSVLRPKKELVFPKYLHYLLFANHKFGITEGFQNKTTGIINLQLQRYINEVKMPLPAPKIQNRIANLLDAVGALCQTAKQIVDSYDELSQSIFIDMFGDPVSNPKGWKRMKFEDIVALDCPLSYGIVQPGDEFENGVPCVRPVDLTQQYIKLDSLKKIDPAISSKFKRTLLKGGEILLSVRGSIGVISIAENSLKGSNVTRGIVPIWFNKEVSNKLFFYYLYKTNSIQIHIKSISKGATLIQLNLSDLRKLNLICPPITLQNHFAEKIYLIEQQRNLAKHSLKESEDLFNTLLQKAFKGELIIEN